MAVVVVTDSSADLPPELAAQLNIKIVPLYVYFNLEVFKDGVDLSKDEFYQRLVRSKALPKTSQPTIEDFKKVYQEVAKTADGIISVHLSSKLSGTYNAALRAKDLAQLSCPIEIVDSLQASLGIGLLAIAVAKKAQQNASFAELRDYAYACRQKIDVYALMDTIDYVIKGGRIGRAKGFIGKLINIKPIVTLRDGETSEYAKARSFARGMETLREAFMKNLPVAELGIIASTNMDDANQLVDSLKPSLTEGASVCISRFGPTLGTYVGPRALGVAVLRK